jgi:hypothetical protein
MNWRTAAGFLLTGILVLPATAPAQHGHTGHGKAAEKTKTEPKASSASKLKPAEGASVKIVSPKAGQVFKGDQVPIEFKLVKGKLGHHVHAYVDGELMGMFESEKGTLTGIKPGKRSLELRVVANDHETELNATDKVQFEVK